MDVFSMREERAMSAAQMSNIVTELDRVAESWERDGDAPRTADLLRRARKEILRLYDKVRLAAVEDRRD
jgi:hypothetical protein